MSVGKFMKEKGKLGEIIIQDSISIIHKMRTKFYSKNKGKKIVMTIAKIIECEIIEWGNILYW